MNKSMWWIEGRLAMMHGYYKMGNVSFRSVSDTSLLCEKFVSLPCPWRVPIVSI